MAGVLCGRVRSLLADAVAGRPLPEGDDVWTTLVEHGAVQGTPREPQVTPVGRHVLSELEVRAYRTDALPLDTVASQLTRVISDLDVVAKTAEYFLGNLGPVAPAEALPLLRPVAVGLANRRGTPEELAEEFRNVWGSVEVMGGDSRDRLLAAELLNASRAPMDTLYAPLMSTTQRIRERFGPAGAAVAPAALLHLHPGPSGDPAFEAFVALRASGLSAEEAGLLAGLLPSAAETIARRQPYLAALQSLGVSAESSRVPASYLTALGADASRHAGRIRELGLLLRGRLPDPTSAATFLSSLDWLEPAELMNWVDKATEIARVRRLAPTDPELLTLGIALVHGLPASEFIDGNGRPAEPNPLRVSAGLLGIHAWIYRPLLARSRESAAGPAPAPARG